MRTQIGRDDVLDGVAKHDVVRPIRHGARVRLPETDEQRLFG
jgi:hypothetical protein